MEKAKAHMLMLKQKWLVIAAYTTLALPVCIFMLGWLHFWWGLLGVLFVVAGLVWLVAHDWMSEEKSVTLPIGHLVGIIACFTLCVALSGVAYIGISSGDISWRNATFHDLVTYDWPVVYDNGAALTYYVTFWMVPALFGKLFGMGVGYAALLVSIVFVLTVVYLLIVCLLGFETPGKMWLAAAFLILWSGAHYLAAAFMTGFGWTNQNYGILTDGLAYMDAFYNGEAFNWYYRSNESVMSQTYNQIMLWVAIALMFSKRSPRGYMALGLLVMPYSPFGFIGLIPVLIAAAMPAFVQIAKEHGAVGVLKQVFPPANIAVTVVIALVFGSYFLASAASGGETTADATVAAATAANATDAAATATSGQTGSFGLLSLDHMSIKTLGAWLIFVCFEFALFAIFLFRDHKKDALFWTVLVELAIVPFIWAGNIDGRDFCMNASIPGIFTLMVFMLDYLRKHVCSQPLRLPQLALVLLLAFSLCGPAFDYFNTATTLLKNHTLAITHDSVVTFEDSEQGENVNFVRLDYEDTFFYRYLAR